MQAYNWAKHYVVKKVDGESVLFRVTSVPIAKKGQGDNADGGVKDDDVESVRLVRFYPVEDTFDVVHFLHGESGHGLHATMQQVWAMARLPLNYS